MKKEKLLGVGMELKYHLQPSKIVVLKSGILWYLRETILGRIWWVKSKVLLVIRNNLNEVCEKEQTIQDTFLLQKFNTID